MLSDAILRNETVETLKSADKSSKFSGLFTLNIRVFTMKNNTPFQFSFDNFPYVLVWQLHFARLDTAFITDYNIVFLRR